MRYRYVVTRKDRRDKPGRHKTQTDTKSEKRHARKLRVRNSMRRLRHYQLKSFRNTILLLIFVAMTMASASFVAIYLLLSVLFPHLFYLFTPLFGFVACLLICTVVGMVFLAILSRGIFRPFKEMIRATEKIAKGDFKVHIEETMDQSTDFGILQHSFNHMAEELDGIEMFRNDFINNFSHEFKTPIVSIRGFARQLQAGGLTEAEQKEYVDIIVAESDRLTKMATNVLLLSKLENQQIVSHKTEFYLDEQIRHVLVMMEKQWSEKDIELNVDLDEVKYCFNEDMLSQVWVNLLGNAIKFTPYAGTVSCTLRQSADAVTVTVSDTGDGMSQEVIRHIFEKFYQGDPSHSGAGNGIGLTIVHRILVLCGGSIQVDSQPGMGSTFTVTLPVTVARASEKQNTGMEEINPS